MYNVNYVENKVVVDSLKTDDIKEIKRFFINKYFPNIENSMDVIKYLEETEGFKFYKNKKDKNKYIEVIR